MQASICTCKHACTGPPAPARCTTQCDEEEENQRDALTNENMGIARRATLEGVSCMHIALPVGRQRGWRGTRNAYDLIVLFL